jgi:MoxR-like ATPase
VNADLNELRGALQRAREQAGKVIIGQTGVIDQCLIAVFCGQHALLEGVPGIAKTLLVRVLAQALGAPFARIQFTPDLMPADITGTNVFNLQKNVFSLVKGPVFTAFLLADEINRAPAKTQSALLQAMQEREVTIDAVSHKLDENFTVFATQNPIEYEGTYPLPEAQKDRFMLKIDMGYPDLEDERGLAARMLGPDSPEQMLARGEVRPVLEGASLPALRAALRAVTVREEIVNYVVEIVRATRSEDSILVGAGPRATQALILGGRARAAIDGRDFVTPDDVKALALPVLGHRVVLRPEFEIEGLTAAEVVDKILKRVTVPR